MLRVDSGALYRSENGVIYHPTHGKFMPCNHNGDGEHKKCKPKAVFNSLHTLVTITHCLDVVHSGMDLHVHESATGEAKGPNTCQEMLAAGYNVFVLNTEQMPLEEIDIEANS